MKMKSSNSNITSLGSGILQTMRMIGMTVMTITAVMVLVGTMLGLAGCSGGKGKSSQAKLESSSVNRDPVVTTPAVTPESKPAVTAKKKSATRRARTVAYSSSTYG